jgi:hypothetical protein
MTLDLANAMSIVTERLFKLHFYSISGTGTKCLAKLIRANLWQNVRELNILTWVSKSSSSCCQFHQHFTSSFYANIIVPKNDTAKL